MAKHQSRSQSAEALAQHEVFQEELARTIEAIVPDGYVEQQITFPPYWKPQLGKGWRGTIVRRDERQSDFPRYVIESAVTLDCQNGPVRDGEIFTVEPGEEFTMGVYAALPLHNYFDMEVAVIAVGSDPLPPNEKSDGRPRTLWRFRLFTNKAADKELKQRKQEERAFFKEQNIQARRKALLGPAKS